MTTDTVTARPDEDVQKVLTLMSDNQVRRIPVINREGRLEGMVSSADLLRRANVSSEQTSAVFKKVSEPTDQASKPRAKMAQKAA
jgi:CBS domain-containing protein